MEKKKLSRREREKLRQRHEILDVALELFSEKGYYNVSMHEIAEKAEFAIGTIYKFFRNKEDLYKTLVLEHAKRFHEAITEAITQGDDEIEKLRNYVRVKGEVFKKHIPMARLYFAETKGVSFSVMAGMDSAIRKLYREFMDHLTLIFKSGIENRIFNIIADPYYLAVALESICNSFLFLWLEEPDLHPYPDDPDIILNILFKSLIDG